MKAIYTRETGEELEFESETMIAGSGEYYIVRKYTQEELDEYERRREKLMREIERRKHMDELKRYWESKRWQEEEYWRSIEKPYLERERECKKRYSKQNEQVRRNRKFATTGSTKISVPDKFIPWMCYSNDKDILEAYNEFAENASPIMEGGE